MKINRVNYRFVSVLAICCIIFSVSGKTRWSSLHIVPDADLLTSGELLVGFDGYIAENINNNMLFRPTVPVRFGISEWINLDIAYSGGITLGLKGRILGETGKIMPSLAIGIHNLFNHKEVNYFYVDSADDMASEFYLALSKSVEPIKTRFHLGIQSIPTNRKDRINPFFAIEKYFGLGLYSSFEFYRRQKEFNLSLFANWRFFKNHFEISVGAVELKSMFLEEDNKFSVSLVPYNSDIFIKPGIWIGLRFHGRFGLGSNKGFNSIEDRFKHQDESIETLVKEVDSLNNGLNDVKKDLKSVKSSLGLIIDSVENDPTRIKNIILEKLISLKTRYKSEPFDPDKVKMLIKEIMSFREKAAPCLAEFLMDNKVDRYVRIYSAFILGEIGSSAYSDVLLDVIARTTDPSIKIEILIALSKMKETRAMYLMEQLANSPNDAVAITAQEVLGILAKETGAEISPDLKMRKISVDEKAVLSDKKRPFIPESSLSSDSGVSEPVIDKISDIAKKDTLIKDTSGEEPKEKIAFKEKNIGTDEDTSAADNETEKKKAEGSKENTGVTNSKSEGSSVSEKTENFASAEDVTPVKQIDKPEDSGKNNSDQLVKDEDKKGETEKNSNSKETEEKKRKKKRKKRLRRAKEQHKEW